ncbi:MAG TPA: HIT domain-containing protein [Novosphingobium sp.]|nr:HIT domain-containing protein [Novosphingobium sp.]
MPIDPSQPYDPDNILARIVRGELPCNKVHEDDYALAFHDIRPQAPVHVLVIPKGAFVSWDDFTAHASDAEIAGFTRAVGAVTRLLELDWPGYRLMVNMGHHGHQEVPHLHVHIFGGRQFYHMICD